MQKTTAYISGKILTAGRQRRNTVHLPGSEQTAIVTPISNIQRISPGKYPGRIQTEKGTSLIQHSTDLSAFPSRKSSGVWRNV